MNIEKESCCGCSACMAACPKQCITMQKDEEGFLYPHIDEDRCIHCGRCDDVCPISADFEEKKENDRVWAYAAQNLSEEERIASSSGGVFSLLAKNILRKNGIVYGVAMTEDFYETHCVRIHDEKDLPRLRGSKYFQADMDGAYIEVKKDLKNGLPVLFSGTGCQINGLKSFLQEEYDNLYCVDVICHGVPSPALWRRYAEAFEKKYGKLENVNFRCKDRGWQDFGMKENKLYISKDKDPFMQMFLRDYCLRPSCYQCKAKWDKRSDMTIADFWGIESVAPEMNDKKGTSLILLRTKKGRHMFDGIKDGMRCLEVSYEDAVRANPAEYKSAARPAQRDTFFKDMEAMAFEELCRKYLRISFIAAVKRKLRSWKPRK